MNELILYDRDKGLFKEILNRSTVMDGRYHVSPNYGHDLSTNNLESFINDPKYGLKTPDQKFPLAVCMTPKSRFVKLPSGQKWEQFIFTIFFLVQEKITGDSQVKDLNKATNTSGHHVWYDWQDMKRAAEDFIEVFIQVIRARTIEVYGVTRPLKTVIQMNTEEVVFNRHARFNADNLSGVSASFAVLMDASQCAITDYNGVDIMTDIVMPPIDIHPLHGL